MSVTPKILLFTLLLPGSLVAFVPWVIRHGVWPPFPESLTGIGLPGLALMAVGVAGYTWCAFEFGARGRGTPAPFDPPTELVHSGPYRLVRNPMFAAVVATLFGEALVCRSLPLLTYASCMAIGFHVRVVLFEEPRLRRKFGATFDRYCSAVPRWLPRLTTLGSRTAAK
jgi:protein-S-isoprenylcysteine O-methyltransferase Ste14